VTAEVCYDRILSGCFHVIDYGTKHAGFPADLAAVEQGVVADLPDPNKASRGYMEFVHRSFSCPVAGPWTYTPPKGVPQVGDVLLRCRAHPENQVTWRERDVKYYLAALQRSKAQ
jgi:hypothetical protein